MDAGYADHVWSLEEVNGFIALAALVAGIVIYRAIWALGREKARNAKRPSN